MWSLCHAASTFNATVNASTLMMQTTRQNDGKNIHSPSHPVREHSINNLPATSQDSTTFTVSNVPSNVHLVGPIQKRVEDGNQHQQHPTAPYSPGQCLFGQLTDQGRETLFSIGQGLRSLYVDRLKFLPPNFDGAVAHKQFYFRTTDYPRTLESIQHLIGGLYPIQYRENAPPVVHTRWPTDETLYGDGQCARWRQLVKQFKDSYRQSQSAHIAQMKLHFARMLKDEAKPNLHALYDTFIAQKAHGIELPQELKDERHLLDLEQHANNLWFRVYQKQEEAASLGIGRFLKELKAEMEGVLQDDKSDRKMSIYSGHDSSIAPLTGALGVGDDDRWPPFASNVTVELFDVVGSDNKQAVRVKYNHQVKIIPYCAEKADRHLSGDKTLCTYEAFKGLLDKMIPADYPKACQVTDLADLGEGKVGERQ